MKTKNNGISIEFNIVLWNKYRATPLWLGVWPLDWKHDPSIKSKLVSLEAEQPSRLFKDGIPFYIPLFLDIGVEKDLVQRSIIKQIKEVLILLGD